MMRMLARPARQETSAGSIFQVNRAVVQNTCRRLCQTQVPGPSGLRHPAARCRDQYPPGEVRRSPVGAAGGGEDQAPGGLCKTLFEEVESDCGAE